MAITLAPEVRKQALASIKQYVPSVYNRAIQDAQRYFQERASDLEGVCFEREFPYWMAQRARPRP